MAEPVMELIRAAQDGDDAAHARLFELVYAELKLVARRQLRNVAHATLDTTGLVHETYLKLACPEALSVESRKHFFVLAAKAMRQIVVDHARARLASKRGAGELQWVSADALGELASPQISPDRLLELDRALCTLENESPRLSSLIELRFFGGLELGEIAALEGVSERTLNRDWRRARAEIYSMLYG